MKLRPALVLVIALVSWTSVLHADEACPRANVRKVDVDAWAKATRKAKTIAELDAAFAKLGLPAVGTDGYAPSCEAPAVRKILVDVFQPKLRDDVAPAQVVQVLANFCDAEGEWQLQRGIVLVPQAGDASCAVETPFLNAAGSGWNDDLCNPTKFAFENLTSATHAVMHVTQEIEWCGTSGSDRGGEVNQSWWELQGLKLEPILKVQTARSYYHSPTPPIETRSATVKAVGKAFPKQVQVVKKVECDRSLEDEFAEDDPVRAQIKACRESKETQRCTYENGSYSCR